MKFRNIAKFTKDIISAKFFGQRIPLKVKHNITFRCNLSCSFCLLKTELNKPNSFEMNTLQIKKMMKEFNRMGTRFWQFSGGEPLLREDLGELISYAKDEMDFYCNITTNGVLLAKKLKEVSSFKKLDLVQVSLEGPREIQDSLSGIGAYDNVISALDALRESRIKTMIIVVLLKNNLRYLGYLIKLAMQYNANIAFQALGNRPAARGISYDFFPSKDEFKSVIEELIREKKDKPFIASSIRYLSMLRDFWPDIPHNIRCYAGQFNCDINPEGFVVPCCAKLNLTDGRYI